MVKRSATELISGGLTDIVNEHIGNLESEKVNLKAKKLKHDVASTLCSYDSFSDYMSQN